MSRWLDESEMLENERDALLLELEELRPVKDSWIELQKKNVKLRAALEWALYQYDNDPVGLGWREGDEQRYQEYRALLDA